MISNFVISNIRTYVPIGVGLLLTWLASSLHVVIDPSSQAGLVALCVAVLSGAYYTLARLIERKWPQTGVLLGVAAKPTYKAAAKKPAKKAAPANMHTDGQTGA